MRHDDERLYYRIVKRFQIVSVIHKGNYPRIGLWYDKIVDIEQDR